MPKKIVRPFNTYGPRQSARAIIPTVIIQILNGVEELKVGNLSPTRDFTFVKDTSKGFISIFESDELFGKVVNIGMNEEISINDLINRIVNIMGVSVNVIQDDNRIRPNKSEVDQLQCDNTKLTTHTNWEPKYDLDSGLKETIKWMRNNSHYYKSNEYNV